MMPDEAATSSMDIRLLVALIAAGVSLAAAFVGILGTVIGHRFNYKWTLERERRAELRKAIIEFGVDAENLVLRSVEVSKIRGHIDKRQMDKSPPELLKALEDFMESYDKAHVAAFFKLIPSFSKLQMIELNEEHLLSTSKLYGEVMKVRYTPALAERDEEGNPKSNPALGAALEKITEWREEQRKRRDI
jgi:hypothetical protein